MFLIFSLSFLLFEDRCPFGEAQALNSTTVRPGEAFLSGKFYGSQSKVQAVISVFICINWSDDD